MHLRHQLECIAALQTHKSYLCAHTWGLENQLFEQYWIQEKSSVKKTLDAGDCNNLERLTTSYLERHREGVAQRERAILERSSVTELHRLLQRKKPHYFYQENNLELISIPSRTDKIAALLALEYICEHLVSKHVKPNSVTDVQALILCSQIYPHAKYTCCPYDRPEQQLIWAAQQVNPVVTF